MTGGTRNMSPNAVPIVPADEGSEGAALAPVTVGAHQTVRTRPVPDNRTTYIQMLLRWKQCNGIDILFSPPELAAAHLGRPLQTHGVAAGVPRGAVAAVRLRHRGLAGRVLGAGGGQRVTCNTLTSLQFYKWIIMPFKQNGITPFGCPV